MSKANGARARRTPGKSSGAGKSDHTAKIADLSSEPRALRELLSALNQPSFKLFANTQVTVRPVPENNRLWSLLLQVKLTERVTGQGAGASESLTRHRAAHHLHVVAEFPSGFQDSGYCLYSGVNLSGLINAKKGVKVEGLSDTGRQGVGAGQAGGKQQQQTSAAFASLANDLYFKVRHFNDLLSQRNSGPTANQTLDPLELSYADPRKIKAHLNKVIQILKAHEDTFTSQTQREAFLGKFRAHYMRNLALVEEMRASAESDPTKAGFDFAAREPEEPKLPAKDSSSKSKNNERSQQRESAMGENQSPAGGKIDWAMREEDLVAEEQEASPPREKSLWEMYINQNYVRKPPGKGRKGGKKPNQTQSVNANANKKKAAENGKDTSEAAAKPKRRRNRKQPTNPNEEADQPGQTQSNNPLKNSLPESGAEGSQVAEPSRRKRRSKMKAVKTAAAEDREVQKVAKVQANASTKAETTDPKPDQDQTPAPAQAKKKRNNRNRKKKAAGTSTQEEEPKREQAQTPQKVAQKDDPLPKREKPKEVEKPADKKPAPKSQDKKSEPPSKSKEQKIQVDQKSTAKDSKRKDQKPKPVTSIESQKTKQDKPKTPPKAKAKPQNAPKPEKKPAAVKPKSVPAVKEDFKPATQSQMKIMEMLQSMEKKQKIEAEVKQMMGSKSEKKEVEAPVSVATSGASKVPSAGPLSTQAQIDLMIRNLDKSHKDKKMPAPAATPVVVAHVTSTSNAAKGLPQRKGKVTAKPNQALPNAAPLTQREKMEAMPLVETLRLLNEKYAKKGPIGQDDSAKIKADTASDGFEPVAKGKTKSQKNNSQSQNLKQIDKRSQPSKAADDDGFVAPKKKNPKKKPAVAKTVNQASGNKSVAAPKKTAVSNKFAGLR